ncbi:alpha/beta fold hydrolase [Solirubrobacter soli]|uniref:alpha/beta fold hydrolase n=1 Tax=Solirubrobacter soli TaxID=363832 RepID=UPI000421D4A4|nr:alpha/beta hydrolase [Solirubrobacter soli]
MRDLPVGNERTVRVYDTGGEGPALLWHHGSPHTGAQLPPLLDAADARGLRLVTYARPSYGGSTPAPGRDVAGAAGDVRALADALGLERFAVMGASGGGPHALACAALLPGRVTAAVVLASPAPYTDAFDWFAGMHDPSSLRAGLAGREARAALPETFDPESFTAADWAVLEAEWAPLGQDAFAAGQAGPDGLIDDEVAFAHPWGFDLGTVAAPVLVVQGGQDRVIPPSHADALLRALPAGELWLRPRDGHVSVLRACPVAMDWIFRER